MENLEFEEELLRRIEEQEKDGYDPGPPLDRRDKAGILALFVLSVAGMVAGYYL